MKNLINRPKISNKYLCHFNEEMGENYHMCFGELKPRIRIKKLGKMGCRAHFNKETPLTSLKKFSCEITNKKINDINLFLNLYQSNDKLRLEKLIYLNNLDLRVKESFNSKKNKVKLLNKNAVKRSLSQSKKKGIRSKSKSKRPIEKQKAKLLKATVLTYLRKCGK